MAKPTTIDSKEAKKRLRAGNRRYQKLKGPGSARGPASFNRCQRTESDRPQWPWDAKQQFPWAVVLTCADSRVIPEAIFDTAVGELFVIRVAGNVANTETVASIEYIVNAKKPPKLVVVLGHEGCGAVKAALAGDDAGHNLNVLMAHIRPAIPSTDCVDEKSPKFKGILKKAVKDNVKNSVKELKDLVRVIPKRNKSVQNLEILPAYYELVSGKVDFTP